MEKFVFKPYISHKFVAILFSIILLLPMLGFSIYILFSNHTFDGFKMFAIPFFIMSFIIYTLYFISKTEITFTKEFIIIHDSKRVSKTYRYEDYHYGYYYWNYKNQLHLILSPCRLDKKSVRSILINSGAYSHSNEQYVILYLNELNEKERHILRKFLSDKVEHIIEYKKDYS